MHGEPGFFGSYGYDRWAGIGEAKPIPTMHELGHSYWGAFPVVGHPQLSWQRADDRAIAPAMAAYHQDILAFMAQPPDEFEILRQRLRDLPGLSIENTEPLFHSLEADIPYTTGGDLSLVPPILQKYWRYFLADGPFGSWENAGVWYRSLSHDNRATAGKFLGFGHLNLDLYFGHPVYTPPADLLQASNATLSAEERQRLTDLAEQFDSLIGDPQLEENLQFWRGYLRDKVALHRSHPDHLRSLELPRAAQLSDALAFIDPLGGAPEERASSLSTQIAVQPVLVNFLPAMDDQTLVKFFASNPNLPEGPTLQATASFVERLQRFGTLVETVLAEGRKSPKQGADELTAFLAETDPDQEQDLRLFFDLLHGTDRDLARETMNQLDSETVQALVKSVPTQLRALFRASDLLDKLGISATAAEADLLPGINLLLEETSGNYRIDQPFLQRLYEIMAQRADTDPRGTARIIAATPFPLQGLILSQPTAASTVLFADIALALQLVRDSDPVIAPPARIVYRLIHADASLAARLLIALDQQGESNIVSESLAYFAYDKARSERHPKLPISLKHDGVFLTHLLDLAGARWLEDRLASAVRLYRQRSESEEVNPMFLHHYRETLEAAAALAPNGSKPLQDIISRAFQ